MTSGGQSIRSFNADLIHIARRPLLYGVVAYSSWCGKGYNEPSWLVDEPATCLWCVARADRGKS